MKKNTIDLLYGQGVIGENFKNFSNADDYNSTAVGGDETADDGDVGLCKGSVAHFFKRFHVVKLMGECGAYKKRGVPVSVILMYLFCRMFSPMSMYIEMRVGAFTEDFSRNVVHDFLKNAKVNWQLFVLKLAALVCGAITSLTTHDDGRYAFIIDDTPLEKRGQDTELVSRVYDHVKNRNILGYHVLTLAWTDGVTAIPVRYSLVASSNDDLVVGPIRADIPKGSLAAKIRQMARTSKPELAVEFLKDAVAAGIKAGVVIFDSWFSTAPLMHRVVTEVGVTAVGRMKDGNQKLWHDGKLMTIRAIYESCRKRRGVADVKLGVCAEMVLKDDGGKAVGRLPVKLVYVKNRSKKGGFVCLVCTDTKIGDKEVVRLYGKRWGIEVLFKNCKQYLKFGKEFHGTSFETQNAQIGLSYARHLFLALAERESDDERSCGELFRIYCKEKDDLSYRDALVLVMTLFVEAMADCGVAEDIVVCVLDRVMSNMPSHLKRVLCTANDMECEAA